jgi:hypothetical protein
MPHVACNECARPRTGYSTEATVRHQIAECATRKRQELARQPHQLPGAIFREAQAPDPQQGMVRQKFSPVIDAELRAAVLAQDPRNLFENWQGVMIGEGPHNIWIRDAIGGDGSQPRYRIVTINNSP